MIIKNIELTHFGKFHGKKMEFLPGLNVFAAENEAGKSTVHAFIRGMFYGIERGRGRASKDDRYLHYEPWENAGAYEGKLRFEEGGTVYRIERSFLKTNKYVKLFNETEGIELTPAQEHIDRLLGGMTESRYSNTISIEQLHSATDHELIEELRNFAVNMGNTRSMNIDMAQTRLRLKKKKKELESRLVPEIEEILAEQKRTCLELAEEADRLMNERDRQEQTYHEKNTQVNEEMKRARKLRKQKDEECSELNRMINHRYREREKCEEERSGLFLTAALCFGALGLVVFAGLVCNVMNLNIPVVSKYWPLFALLVLLGSAAILIRRSQTWRSELRAMSDEIDLLTGHFEELKADTAVDLAEQDAETHRQELQALAEARNHAEWELETLLKQQNEADSLLQELQEKQQQNEKWKTEIAAVELAATQFDVITQKIHETFGVRLNQSASDYFSLITGGKYTDLRIDEDMNVYVNTPDKLIPLESCSRGTIEQIYLCIRLAAAHILSTRDDMPIILDDVFAYYDNKRLAETLEILDRLKNQVILFTCHTRESSWRKQNIQRQEL